MENGIQDKVWDVRIFGHAIRINKRPNNDAKNGKQNIAIILGQIRNNIYKRHFGVFKHQKSTCQTCQNDFGYIKI